MTIILYDIVTAFRRAGGFCECTKADHNHKGRCENPILWRSRGLRTPLGLLFGSWEIRHIINPKKGGSNNLGNLKVFCFECDRKLRGYSLRFKQ